MDGAEGVAGSPALGRQDLPPDPPGQGTVRPRHPAVERRRLACVGDHADELRVVIHDRTARGAPLDLLLGQEPPSSLPGVASRNRITG
jgi:hypothetical protein